MARLLARFRRNPLATGTPVSTGSAMAVGGHPIHPTLVHFPIAFLIGAFASDVAYWWTWDPFWARLSFWMVWPGFGFGILAALVGTLDFLLVKEIRRFLTSWNHFLLGVMLVSLAGANAVLRLEDPVGAVTPWGLVLSALSVLALMFAGLLGGQLVYGHNIATADTPDLRTASRPREG